MKDMMAGHIEIIITILSFLLALHIFNMKRLNKMHKNIKELSMFKIEHEMVIDFMCKSQGIQRSDLPTRHRDGTIIDITNGN